MPTLQELKSTLELIDKIPSFQPFAPKRWVVPTNYINPRLLSLVFYDSFIQTRRKKSSMPVEEVIIFLCTELKHLNFPVFFVSPELFVAAAQTTPPLNTILGHIKWPLNAMAFFFPQKESREMFGTDVHFGAIGKVRGQHITTGKEFETILTLAQYTDPGRNDGIISWLHSYCPVCCENSIQTLLDHGQLEIHDKATTLNEAIDQPLAEQLIKLLYNLVLIMTAQPRLVKNEVLLRKENTAKGICSLWHPNFIGANYKHHRESNNKLELTQSGTHASPRMHWRRGHFRNQHHGKELKEVKIIWIEPVLVNSNEQSENTETK